MKYIFLFCCFLFISCNKQNKNEPIPDTATSGAFELVADETLKPAIDSLVYGFNASTPNAKVTVRYKNATEALDDLLQAKARLVIIARPLSQKERDVFASQKTEVTEAEVAESSIGCIVSSKSPLHQISFDSLKSLVENELGGKGLVRISSSYLSSTEYVLDSIFVRTKYQEGLIKRFQTTDSIFSAIKNDAKAIGFVNASWLKKLEGDSSFRVLEISGPDGKPIMLHPAYVLQGLYPLASRICAYTTEVPNTLPRGFLAYAMAAEGQRVFLNFNLLPKTQILKLVPGQ